MGKCGELEACDVKCRTCVSRGVWRSCLSSHGILIARRDYDSKAGWEGYAEGANIAKGSLERKELKRHSLKQSILGLQAGYSTLMAWAPLALHFLPTVVDRVPSLLCLNLVGWARKTEGPWLST